VLIAEEELRNEPAHVTIVDPKDDPRSSELYRAALSYPIARTGMLVWLPKNFDHTLL
jgi:hypothetical protein